jgi:hypothetical protein
MKGLPRQWRKLILGLYETLARQAASTMRSAIIRLTPAALDDLNRLGI